VLSDFQSRPLNLARENRLRPQGYRIHPGSRETFRTAAVVRRVNATFKASEEAAAYLTAHLEGDDPDAEELFLLALRDVAAARGLKRVAKVAKLGRESLYKALSRSGNPKLSTLVSVLRAMGLKLAVETKRKKAP